MPHGDPVPSPDPLRDDTASSAVVGWQGCPADRWANGHDRCCPPPGHIALREPRQLPLQVTEGQEEEEEEEEEEERLADDRSWTAAMTVA